MRNIPIPNVKPYTEPAENTNITIPGVKPYIETPNILNTPEAIVNVRSFDKELFDSYKSYVGYVNPDVDMDFLRARHQNWQEQVGLAFANFLPNFVTGFVRDVATLGSLLFEWGEDRDYRNVITDLMEKAHNPFGEIYREHPEKIFDFNDPASYVNFISSNVEMLASFALVGAGLTRVFGGIGRAARYLTRVAELSEAYKGAATVEKVISLGEKLGTNLTMDYIMAAHIAKAKYDEYYNYALEQLKFENNYNKLLGKDYLTESEIEGRAKKIASDGASNVAQLVVLGMLPLNHTLVNSLFVPNKYLNKTKWLEDNKIISDEIKSKFKNKTLEERLKEYESYLTTVSTKPKVKGLGRRTLDEAIIGTGKFGIVPAVAEGVVNEKYSDKSFEETLFSPETLEGIISGGIINAGQFYLMSRLSKVPIYDEKGNKIGKENPIKAEMIYRAREIEKAVEYSKQDIREMMEGLADLRKAKDEDEITRAKKKLFNVTTKRNVINGSAEHLINFYEYIANLDNTKEVENGKTQAMLEGVAKEKGDYSYKELAIKAIQDIKKYEDLYKDIMSKYNISVKEQNLGYAEQIFRLALDRDDIKDNINYLQNKINKLSTEIEERIKTGSPTTDIGLVKKLIEKNALVDLINEKLREIETLILDKKSHSDFDFKFKEKLESLNKISEDFKKVNEEIDNILSIYDESFKNKKIKEESILKELKEQSEYIQNQLNAIAETLGKGVYSYKEIKKKLDRVKQKIKYRENKLNELKNVEKEIANKIFINETDRNLLKELHLELKKEQIRLEETTRTFDKLLTSKTRKEYIKNVEDFYNKIIDDEISKREKLVIELVNKITGNYLDKNLELDRIEKEYPEFKHIIEAKRRQLLFEQQVNLKNKINLKFDEKDFEIKPITFKRDKGKISVENEKGEILFKIEEKIPEGSEDINKKFEKDTKKSKIDEILEGKNEDEVKINVQYKKEDIDKDTKSEVETKREEVSNTINEIDEKIKMLKDEQIQVINDIVSISESLGVDKNYIKEKYYNIFNSYNKLASAVLNKNLDDVAVHFTEFKNEVLTAKDELTRVKFSQELDFVKERLKLRLEDVLNSIKNNINNHKTSDADILILNKLRKIYSTDEYFKEKFEEVNNIIDILLKEEANKNKKKETTSSVHREIEKLNLDKELTNEEKVEIKKQLEEIVDKIEEEVDIKDRIKYEDDSSIDHNEVSKSISIFNRRIDAEQLTIDFPNQQKEEIIHSGNLLTDTKIISAYNSLAYIDIEYAINPKTNTKYDKKLIKSTFNPVNDMFELQKGDEVTVSIDKDVTIMGDDGKLINLYSVYKNDVGNIPLVVKYKGKVIGHIRTKNWVEKLNKNGEPANVVKNVGKIDNFTHQKERLAEFRQRLYDELKKNNFEGEIVLKIADKTHGHILRNYKTNEKGEVLVTETNPSGEIELQTVKQSFKEKPFIAIGGNSGLLPYPYLKTEHFNINRYVIEKLKNKQNRSEFENKIFEAAKNNELTIQTLGYRRGGLHIIVPSNKKNTFFIIPVGSKKLSEIKLSDFEGKLNTNWTLYDSLKHIVEIFNKNDVNAIREINKLFKDAGFSNYQMNGKYKNTILNYLLNFISYDNIDKFNENSHVFLNAKSLGSNKKIPLIYKDVEGKYKLHIIENHDDLYLETTVTSINGRNVNEKGQVEIFAQPNLYFDTSSIRYKEKETVEDKSIDKETNKLKIDEGRVRTEEKVKIETKVEERPKDINTTKTEIGKEFKDDYFNPLEDFSPTIKDKVGKETIDIDKKLNDLKLDYKKTDNDKNVYIDNKGNKLILSEFHERGIHSRKLNDLKPKKDLNYIKEKVKELIKKCE